MRAPNNTAPKYMKQKPTKLKGERNNSTIIVLGGLNQPSDPIIPSLCSQHNMAQKTSCLKSGLNKLLEPFVPRLFPCLSPQCTLGHHMVGSITSLTSLTSILFKG